MPISISPSALHMREGSTKRLNINKRRILNVFESAILRNILALPVLVNTTNTSVYNMFIAQHIYFHLLQSSRVNRNTRLQVFQDQCFAISLVTRTFCERSVEEFDSVKHSHFHIETYGNCEVVSTFSSRKKGEVSTC